MQSKLICSMSQSPLNPSLFTSQATNSPSKVSVPSRKQRNQPATRVHDIEFATEISTSLLAQVRQLQALLAEREEALRTINLEKSRLELEAEGYAQRIRALDESEERYKDENWALETRTQELMATIREGTDRETKLNSNLSAINNEKGTVERELEDLKQVNAKLIEDHAAAQKTNDAEVHQMRRNLNSGDAEKHSMQQKIEELNAQNDELAKAVAIRLRQHESGSTRHLSPNSDSDEQNNETPDNSPPPSPNKFTPRHNHLETETLRSSLGHAHRMIQNLKSTIHREKTEKIELKRMLQESRDEVEQRRREGTAAGGSSSKRQKSKPESARKAPRPDLLGAGRKGRTEIEEVQDTDWEDNSIYSSPPHKTPSKPPQSRSVAQSSSDERSDAYQTATENDDPFETANERDTTESEAFQTGVESMADDSSASDDLTETEDTVRKTPRGRMSSSKLMMAKARDRAAYSSTASTSASEDEDAGFSSPSQISTPRRHLRMRRSVLRRVRPSGEAPMATNSRPSSARNSPATSFVQEQPALAEGQSLFAELAELDGTEGEEDDGNFGQTSSFEAPSQGSTPRMAPAPDSRRPSEVALDAPAKPVMVDSGIMTDPWEPTAVPAAVTDAPSTEPSTPTRAIANESEETTTSKDTPELVGAAVTQGMTPLKSPSGPNGDQSSSVQTPPKMVWDEHDPEAGEGGERAVPVAEPPQLEYSSMFTQETAPVAPTLPDLGTSYVVGGMTEPVKLPAPEAREVIVSSIQSQSTEPVLATLPEPTPVYMPEMVHSSVFSQATEPIVATLPEPEPPVTLVEQGTSMDLPELAVSTIVSEETEPITATLPETHTAPMPVPVPVPMPTEQTTASRESPELSVSSINSEFTEPMAPKKRDIPMIVMPELSFSSINSVETPPIQSVSDEGVSPVVGMMDENAPPMVSRSVGGDEEPTASDPSGIVVAKDGKPANTSKSTGQQVTDGARPLSAISGNASRSAHRRAKSNQADQGAQTILSSKQIDQILMDRVSSRPMSPPDSDRSKETGISPFATPKAKPRPTHRASATSLPAGHKRPDSATSHVSSAYSHPPLPADHREAISAAERGEQRPASPSVMGPPLAPASAYRANGALPRTPHEQSIPAGSTRTTSSRSKLIRESQMSRKSSVSSFASEIDERFNVQPNGGAGFLPHGYSEGTDPRMIQAITQTMIGEFLWKYTRRHVSDEMSSTRHRRYFWVHPYTRTLYWSEQDPQHAGKTELKTKSVPIEAVRVVADDNPYPPGLHCRSLEVVSPGRRVRFTATTSQRHETWFNALSYLLLRDSDDNSDGKNSITLEDIDEFNPGFRSNSRQTARMSFSSAQSRTLRNPINQRAGSAMSFRQPTTPGRVSPALSAPQQSSPFLVPDQSRQSSSGRLSTILNTTIKGSFGRKGRHGYSTSSVNEGSINGQPSMDDLRQAVAREEREMDGLENVRACCDGEYMDMVKMHTNVYTNWNKANTMSALSRERVDIALGPTGSIRIIDPSPCA